MTWRIWLIIFAAFVSLAAERDQSQVRAFRKDNPCPATQKTSGSCNGWVVDHIVPLCWGGEDSPKNMQWQSAKESYLKDKFEREACAMKKKYQSQPLETKLK